MVTVILLGLALPVFAEQDFRLLVKMPLRMQEHMLGNMRDHLAAVNDILALMAAGELDEAARTSESRLGMSSLNTHGAAHMEKWMPAQMQQLGTRMHRAASRFALRAQEGDPLPAYRALGEVTSACVACHAGYRIR